MQRMHKFALIALLLIVPAVLYGQFLWNPAVFDDLQFFTMDRTGRLPIEAYHFSPFELRSLPYATMAWESALWGAEVFHFRLGNLLLHLAVTIALYFFLVRLFDAIYSVRVSLRLNSCELAFFGALLFALHPVAVYATGYLIQRTIVMAALFSLLAMLAYLHGSTRDKPLWLWAIVPLYYLAVYSKEHAIMLPAVLLALTILLHTNWKDKLKQRWLVFIALGVIAGFVLAAKKGIFGSVYEPSAPALLLEIDSALTYPLSVLTQSWLFFKYIGLWLFPNPVWMSVDMREPFAQSLLSPYLLALLAFIAWGVSALWLLMKRGRAGLIGLAMLFPWLMFMTEFSTVRIQESFVLYRSYLWAVGACCLLPLLLDWLEKRMAVAVLAAVLVAMFTVSMERLSTFSHPLLLWEDAEKLVVGRDDLSFTTRIYNNKGLALLDLMRFDEAIAAFNRAIQLAPDMPHSYTNLGATYLKMGKWQTAIASFDKAIQIMVVSGKEWDSRPFLGRARAFENLGDVENARRNYEVSCKLAKKGCDKL